MQLMLCVWQMFIVYSLRGAKLCRRAVYYGMVMLGLLAL
jgi:hypothetical protein